MWCSRPCHRTFRVMSAQLKRMPVSPNRTPIARTINPINRVTMSCSRLPPPLLRGPPPATSTITAHITATATATATSAVVGSANFACATASVMTPVIVPGLAANKISGVSDRFSTDPSSERRICASARRSAGSPLAALDSKRCCVNHLRDRPMCDTRGIAVAILLPGSLSLCDGPIHLLTSHWRH